MSVYFIDTSSLAKRYVAEIGSKWLRNLIKPIHGHQFIVSELCKIEMFSLLARLEYMKVLTPALAGQYRFQFLVHAQTEYLVVPVDKTVLRSARKLVVKHVSHKLRTLDAIHLASAIKSRTIISQTITFVSSDNALLDAATSEKFSVDDPNLHP